MVTATAISVFGYSAVAFAGGLLLLVLSFRWPQLRGGACRMLALFGVFAIASAYVWIELGPEADHRQQAKDQYRPWLTQPAEREA